MQIPQRRSKINLTSKNYLNVTFSFIEPRCKSESWKDEMSSSDKRGDLTRNRNLEQCEGYHDQEEGESESSTESSGLSTEQQRQACLL